MRLKLSSTPLMNKKAFLVIYSAIFDNPQLSHCLNIFRGYFDLYNRGCQSNLKPKNGNNRKLTSSGKILCERQFWICKMNNRLHKRVGYSRRSVIVITLLWIFIINFRTLTEYNISNPQSQMNYTAHFGDLQQKNWWFEIGDLVSDFIKILVTWMDGAPNLSNISNIQLCRS